MNEAVGDIFDRGLITVAGVALWLGLGFLLIVLVDGCSSYPAFDTVMGAGVVWAITIVAIAGAAGVFLVVAGIFLLGAAMSAVLRVLKLIAEA